MGLRIQVAIKTQALVAIGDLSLTLRESSHAKRRQLALGILERDFIGPAESSLLFLLHDWQHKSARDILHSSRSEAVSSYLSSTSCV